MRITFYARVLRVPLLVMVLATAAVHEGTRRLSISSDTEVMGLLSQFDGTATTVFVALATLRASVRSETPEGNARMWRRSVRFQFAAAFALVAFVVATAAAHYTNLGSWAVALNITTTVSVLWALVGPIEPA
ncbi:MULTISPECIES: hypothetical protein [Streptomyces]|uniref:Uncharacterized protein n=1 Tax=Streptomyces doudnae TaxID=3075536 RepID=A0ABD5EPN8_9ACTN|nr:MULTISPECIES: hypothetical protein [unclassified Streptomyces]MDT0436004.1 hypothetical protein [Streptomyces sp. DSM 41981]MYQ64548.1 hypothetical protein [Streptomyces sp. SID4950]SCD81286.1 hypothetical protein GA0115242_115115 [Streptomyces sp. SolWspMP-5a-2]